MINVGLIFAVSVLAAREILGVSHWYIEDGYFDRLNPEYVDVNKTNLEVVWINSTLSGVAINITFVKELPRGTMAHFNMFEKKNGGYNAHSGISVSQPWCKGITDRVLVGGLLRAMNLAQCPVPPGTYSVAEYAPTANSLMPDYLPGNQYRLSLVVRTKRTVLLVTRYSFNVFSDGQSRLYQKGSYLRFYHGSGSLLSGFSAHAGNAEN